MDLPTTTFPPTDAPPLFVDLLLAEQERHGPQTAVDVFARRHERHAAPDRAARYRDLIPLSQPGPGEQLAFEVDLDACSGCKACVAACHSLNGLEEDELWRSVGLLTGGATTAPVLQHVTTACHHCLAPACLEGCPVRAYEKDPVTGIVRHLDDQCIGCQYCILKCPYDVPKYSRSKGIVRKCDLCHTRLAADEAPACVAGCPNRAIRVSVVSRQAIVEESEANQFLPGTPQPGYTLPTTIYKTNRPLPRNLLPADYFSARPQAAHWPLVVMLVLTQMSVGTFVVQRTLDGWWSAATHGGAAPRPTHAAGALVLGLIGLAASVLHLGRPLLAFRAVIGLRTSWLSREILAFGLFALGTSAYAAVAWRDGSGDAPSVLHCVLGSLAAAAGAAGVAASVMVYVDTRRPFWAIGPTAAKFVGTAIVLGAPTALWMAIACASWADGSAVRHVMDQFGRSLCRWLILAAAIKLAVESLVFFHLRHAQHTPLRRTAMMMVGELRGAALWRYALGAVGGIVVPGVLVIEPTLAPLAGFHPAFILAALTLAVGALFLGELAERYLFFAAVVAPKMPGSPAS